jgi:hypothetical protein
LSASTPANAAILPRRDNRRSHATCWSASTPSPGASAIRSGSQRLGGSGWCDRIRLSAAIGAAIVSHAAPGTLQLSRRVVVLVCSQNINTTGARSRP